MMALPLNRDFSCAGLMSSRKLNAVFAALAMLLTSCASSYQMYSGRALPNNAVAILRQQGHGPAVVLKVDGKEVEGGLTYAGIGYNRWELTPGKHSVEVDLHGFEGGMKTNRPQTVIFTAEAGQVYDVGYTTNKFLGHAGIFTNVFSWEPRILRVKAVTDKERVRRN
jgi:hypothetical protein